MPQRNPFYQKTPAAATPDKLSVCFPAFHRAGHLRSSQRHSRAGGSQSDSGQSLHEVGRSERSGRSHGAGPGVLQQRVRGGLTAESIPTSLELSGQHRLCKEQMAVSVGLLFCFFLFLERALAASADGTSLDEHNQHLVLFDQPTNGL